MNISEYKSVILSSSPNDWSVSLHTVGFNNHENHSHTATLKSDLSISISWGKMSNENFSEPWANSFPDPSAHSEFIDFVYNGNLVYSESFVVVDGGRCLMPMFNNITDENNNILGYTATQEQMGFYDVLDTIGALGNLTSYIDRLRRGGTNIQIAADTDWLSGS